jgi:predicted urease superfamily metal-dependent hydrolase
MLITQEHLDRLDEAAVKARENLRQSLKAYAEILEAGIMITDRGTAGREHYDASRTQVESARRVLWMD